jgi:hypothetical protein
MRNRDLAAIHPGEFLAEIGVSQPQSFEWLILPCGRPRATIQPGCIDPL